jgi:recombinational DNA repair protein RecR
MAMDRLTKCNECGTLHKGMAPPQCAVCGERDKSFLRQVPVPSRRRPDIPDVVPVVPR